MIDSKKKRIRLPKLTHKEIELEFDKFGYTLLSEKYEGIKQQLSVRCENGHDWNVCWNNFSRGTRCRKCLLDSFDRNNLKKIVLRNQHFNISEVARILQVRDSDFRRHVIAGFLPAPTHEINNSTKKYYKQSDIDEINEMIF